MRLEKLASSDWRIRANPGKFLPLWPCSDALNALSVQNGLRSWVLTPAFDEKSRRVSTPHPKLSRGERSGSDLYDASRLEPIWPRTAERAGSSRLGTTPPGLQIAVSPRLHGT